MMARTARSLLLAAVFALAPGHGFAQTPAAPAATVGDLAAPGPLPPEPAAPWAVSLSWTDWADLALASPAIVRVVVERARVVPRRRAPEVPPGDVRVIVEARLVSALKAPQPLPERALWSWQGPEGPRGRSPLGPGQELLVFLVPEAPGPRPEVMLYRLANAAGQQPWSEAGEALVRRVLLEERQGVARRVDGVENGFHVEGAVTGESESQFFLRLAEGGAQTLTVLRRPGAEPQVLLATGDLIDESARPVSPRTLVWRQLACELTPELPPRLAADRALARDWAEVRRRIGPCGRTLGQSGETRPAQARATSTMPAELVSG